MHESGNMDWSDPRGEHELPSDWTWERFKEVRSPANFGLRNRSHSRSRARNAGDIVIVTSFHLQGSGD